MTRKNEVAIDIVTPCTNRTLRQIWQKQQMFTSPIGNLPILDIIQERLTGLLALISDHFLEARPRTAVAYHIRHRALQVTEGRLVPERSG